MVCADAVHVLWILQVMKGHATSQLSAQVLAFLLCCLWHNSSHAWGLPRVFFPLVCYSAMSQAASSAISLAALLSIVLSALHEL